MSRLREMIKELCPDGVAYRKLGEILSRHKGIAITAGRMKELHTPDGEIRIFAAGNTYADVMESDVDRGGIIREPAIIVKSRGNIGFEYYTKPFSHKNEMWSYTTNHAFISLKYVYYVLEQNMAYFQNKAKTGKLPQISISDTENYEIPVPPLPIQNEIVKLLDNFTELTAELTAELALRKKQYNFYRDSLLNFDQKNSKVEWKTLGDVCDILSGYPFDSSQFVNNGIRLMRGMNVKRGVLDFQEGNNRYWKNTDGLDKYKLEADDIIIAMDGSLVGQSYGLVKEEHLPLLLVQRVARVRSKESNSHYVYHYISSGKLTEYVNAKRTAGAVPHISLKDIEKFEIPFPDIEKQNKIAEILDRFDTLCNDLTQGLPAEIAARKKQYEYYRDKLLTFPRKAV